MSLALEIVKVVIAIVCSSLFSSLFIHWWRKRKNYFVLFDMNSHYEIEPKESEPIDVTITVHAGFFNGSDETVSVTDILGILIYNKEVLNKYGIDLPQTIASDVLVLDEVIPVNILPHETVKRNLQFKFPQVFVSAIQRGVPQKFLGFLELSPKKHTVLNIIDYRQDWNTLPFTLYLSVHLNADKVKSGLIHVYKKDETPVRGSFSLGHKKQAELDFIELTEKKQKDYEKRK